MMVEYDGGYVYAERMTEKLRHNRNCIYVDSVDGIDLYVCGEKFYYEYENE
jgi:hypothetical protein